MLHIKVGGILRRTANGEIKNFAKGEIIDSANEVITKASIIKFGKAIPHPERKIPLPLACIEFLPGEGPNPLSPSTTGELKKMKYQGQFGFDFFRKKNSLYTDEKSFFDSLPLDKQTGYYSENGAYKQYKTVRDQYEALCKEYKKHSIAYRTQKAITQGWESEESTYYIPYMTLYSKEYVDSITSEYKPVYEAYLSMIVEIEKDIDQWKFEYDTSLFKHSLEIPLEIKKCQPTKHGCNLKITCLKDFDTEQEIRVYAYPKGSNGKNELEQENMKELAGVIKVLPNSANHRKKVNILAVQLKTRVDDTKVDEVQRGEFYNNQIQRFHYMFNQAYIEPEITIFKATNGDDFLDLTNDTMLKKNTSYVNGRGVIKKIYKSRIECQKYISSLIYEEYKKANIVLYFWGIEGESARADTDPGSRCSFIYYNETFNNGALSYDPYVDTPVHEAFHALELPHTFFESMTNLYSSRFNRYFFKRESTCNIMDYSTERNFLYKWQWDLIRKEIEVKL